MDVGRPGGERTLPACQQRSRQWASGVSGLPAEQLAQRDGLCRPGSTRLSIELDVPAAGAPICREWELLLRAKLDAPKKALALRLTMRPTALGDFVPTLIRNVPAFHRLLALGAAGRSVGGHHPHAGWPGANGTHPTHFPGTRTNRRALVIPTSEEK